MQAEDGGSRLNIGPIAVLTIVLFLIVRLFLMANGPNPGEAARPTPTPTPTLAPTATPTPQFYKPDLAACPQLEDKVGLYLSTDAACRPSKTLTVAELEAVSRETKLLRENEKMQPLRLPSQPTCAYAITTTTQLAGWLCTDAAGLYRADDLGRDRGGPHWQWSTEGVGTWLPVSS